MEVLSIDKELTEPETGMGSKKTHTAADRQRQHPGGATGEPLDRQR